MSALFGGLLGAAVGAVAFEVVGALAFPLALTTRPIPVTWGSRLVAHLLVAVCAAAGAAVAARERASETSS